MVYIYINSSKQIKSFDPIFAYDIHTDACIDVVHLTWSTNMLSCCIVEQKCFRWSKACKGHKAIAGSYVRIIFLRILNFCYNFIFTFKLFKKNGTFRYQNLSNCHVLVTQLVSIDFGEDPTKMG